MTISSNPSTKRNASMAALLLLLATASGCGVLPTAPTPDPTAGNDASVATMSMDLDPLVIDGGAGDIGGGGDAGADQPQVDPIREIVTTPALRPGNSEWGHSHRKPKN